jgi:tripartite-type tricarboxylate transporter receptor subunit TctC
MWKRLLFVALVFVAFLTVRSAYGAAPFYEGKTIRIIVGTSPGGGYDTYTRVIARHWARHIPGNPTIVVDNMVGAGGRIAANHMYKVAKPDGLTIGHFVGTQFMQQLLGSPGIEFDAQQFEYIGVPAKESMVIGIAKAMGVGSVEEWMATKKTIKFGGIAPGDITYDIPKLLEATLGLPIQVVTGYKGTGPIRLAFNGGEIAGVSAAWESLRATWRNELDTGELIIALQVTPQAHPELANVPLATKLAKTDEARKLLEVAAQSIGPTARPYLLPPGTPTERVAILRKSFLETTKDAGMLAEAAKARLTIHPGSGEELERNIKAMFKLEPDLVAKLKEILK